MVPAFCSALALGACASVALAEPVPSAAGANDVATAETHAAGPVALTEAEMDDVAAGAFYLRPHYQIDNALASSYQTGGGTNDGSQLLK